ncbi:MAG: xanthine dehydrogenase family protein molybdopterin-binding subunit [Deltaproteobacteria bacterium]|nr:xanthine dehydrogenase family protein molybdopterin-binding subunit [Deltaproteobacteria bacterium]
MKDQQYHAIGKTSIRKDGIAKVTGQEIYTTDVVLPRMLHARVIRSPFPHARIKSIDTREAEKIGAVCITPKDVPPLKYAERIVTIPSKTFKDRHVLTNTPRHVGEAIAAVAAESEDLAEQAAGLVRIEYEKLPPLFDAFEAMKVGSPLIHHTILFGQEEIHVKNNIAASREIVEGDIEKGFKEAEIIFEETFETGRVYHAQMEPKSVVCQPEADGGITVWTTTQTIHNVRQLLGEIFQIPLSKVNVKKVALGGSFGSSIQMNSVVPIGVALALKARRPVKLISTREEDMHDHCKYPSWIRLKLGVRKDGKLAAGHMRAVVDIGAHNTQAYPLLGCMAGWWVSLYKLPHLKFEGQAVYTNKVPACAMQGFGNPQVTFAVESMMDMVAEKLEMDPVELRLKNYVGLGETFWGQGPTVKSIIRSCGVDEMLRKGSELVDWKNKFNQKKTDGIIRKGIGVARGFHTSGAGAPMAGEVIDYSGSIVKINEDGSVDFLTALMDLGGGTLDALAKIVAEELKVPLDKVGISPVDTRTTVYDVCTHATRGIYCGGGALHKVTGQAKTKLLEFASRILQAPPHSLKMEVDEEAGQGMVYVDGVQGKRISVGEVAKTAQINDWGTIAAVDSLRQVSCPPCFMAYFIEVEVNTETGVITPTKALAYADVGQVINPELAKGQLFGGLYRGLSYALLEDTQYDETSGDLTSGGWVTDFKMLTANDLPKMENIEVHFTDTYEPTGPFGAKGIGEAALNPVAGALANAVYNAIGIRFKKIPITPEDVLEALKGKETAK